MTFYSKNSYFKFNGRKGGRPKQDSSIHITLPDINLVMLTSEQYNLLLEKYGVSILKQALKILDNWLIHGGISSEKYVGRNNYAHFRSDGWVLNEAKRLAAKSLN